MRTPRLREAKTFTQGHPAENDSSGTRAWPVWLQSGSPPPACPYQTWEGSTWGDVPSRGRGSEGEGTVPPSPGSLPWFLLSPSPSLSPCLSCCLELAVFGGGRWGPVSLSSFWGSVFPRLPFLIPQKEARPGFTKGRRPRPRVGAGGPGLPLTLFLLSPVCPCPSLRPCVRAGPQRPSCSYVLCTVLLSLAVLLAVAVTGAVLLLNHARVPGTAPPPVVSTGPAGANSALVTVDRADSSRLSILIDPRCPDLADGFARLEGAQASVLQALSQRQTEPRLPGEQEQELLDTLADQLPRLLARASELQAECSGLRKGHGALGQGLSALQSEQGRLIQVRWGSVPPSGSGQGWVGWLPPPAGPECLVPSASLHPRARGCCDSHLWTSR